MIYYFLVLFSPSAKNGSFRRQSQLKPGKYSKRAQQKIFKRTQWKIFEKSQTENILKGPNRK